MELIIHVPPPLLRLRYTMGAKSSHKFFVSNPRLVLCGALFFRATSVLWNSLSSSVFPAHFNLHHFKTHVCAHLQNFPQMTSSVLCLHLSFNRVLPVYGGNHCKKNNYLNNLTIMWVQLFLVKMILVL